MIGLSSFVLSAFNEHALGGLVLLSHEYTWEMENNTDANLPFLKRLRNFVNMSYYIYYYYYYHALIPNQQKLAEKYFGPLPPLLDVLKNVSLLFINQADVMIVARPKLANIITYTSSHIEKKLTPLPKDLEAFLDGATNGFIYFSLGNNARSVSLPLEIRRVFCDVFTKLSYKLSGNSRRIFPGNLIMFTLENGSHNKLFLLIRTLNCSFVKEACRAARRPSTMEYQFLVSRFSPIKIIK